MKFTHYNLGYQQRGTAVEVTLQGNAANVQLLDSSNFQNYKSGKRYKYSGGLARRSPIQLVVPRNGHWHVTVDLRGLRGQVRSSIRILSNPLPPFSEPSPAQFSSVVSDTTSTDDDTKYDYDVFISHATEDKNEIVRPLAEALIDQGVRVWYDEFELRIGDNLRRKIDEGLAQSRFGVVVLSQAFFEKNWTQYELDGLVAREMNEERVILPLWHRVTKQEVISYSPSLADIIALATLNFTIVEIAQEIANVIQNASVGSDV